MLSGPPGPFWSRRTGRTESIAMRPIPAAGLLIGAFCAIWTFVMASTGWYKDPSRAFASYLVLVFEVGGLIWALRRTADEGRTYSGQVAAGALISLVAGLVMFGASLLLSTVVFPDSLQEAHAALRDTLLGRGMSDAKVTELVRLGPPTPLQAALAAFSGTFVRGVVAAAIIGVWMRARPGTGPDPDHFQGPASHS